MPILDMISLLLLLEELLKEELLKVLNVYFVAFGSEDSVLLDSTSFGNLLFFILPTNFLFIFFIFLHYFTIFAILCFPLRSNFPIPFSSLRISRFSSNLFFLSFLHCFFSPSPFYILQLFLSFFFLISFYSSSFFSLSSLSFFFDSSFISAFLSHPHTCISISPFFLPFPSSYFFLYFL